LLPTHPISQIFFVSKKIFVLNEIHYNCTAGEAWEIGAGMSAIKSQMAMVCCFDLLVVFFESFDEEICGWD
jgi:hypothetical protein